VFIYIYISMHDDECSSCTGSYNFISSFTFGDFADVTYVLHGAREMGINGHIACLPVGQHVQPTAYCIFQ